ncbi:MAG: hypothetical protein ACI9T8_000329 [Candidatus Saccharimonadales bacterium]|jgi:hypothetical protein
MYAGTNIFMLTGGVFGTHQKIDKNAHKHLLSLIEGIGVDCLVFPTKNDILHFEGNNGPDSIKRKSPAKDEPWHFYDPFDAEDTQLIYLIEGHYKELVKQLKKGSPERAAFDAAWIAHAIVDGLTPAHHYPYEQELTELRGGNVHERDSVKSKLMIKGDTKRDSVKRNWGLWGVGGLLSMHAMFEGGVAFIMAPLSIKNARPTEGDIETLIEVGYAEYFKRAAREIALLDMYERFYKRGWSPKLVRDVRNELGPIVIKTLTLIWYSALRDAGLLKK